jgi:hypothetical protein
MELQDQDLSNAPAESNPMNRASTFPPIHNQSQIQTSVFESMPKEPNLVNFSVDLTKDLGRTREENETVLFKQLPNVKNELKKDFF